MSLPAARPDAVGLDPQRLAAADAHVRQGAEDGAYPGAVLLVARAGRTAHLKAFGVLGPGGAPTRPDTIYDLASVTKPHVATALLTLVEDGRAALAQTVDEWLPEAARAPCARATLHQLATHTSGLPPWKPLHEAGGKPAMLAELLRTPLDHAAGSHYAYSDLGYILLGEVVARAAGMDLAACLRDRLFQPLGLIDTGYLPGTEAAHRAAVTANCPMRPGHVLAGQVHDANAHAFGGVAGHAGLFGTAEDVATLATALAGSAAGERRLLGLPTLRLAQTSQIPASMGGHTIGWFAAPNPLLPRGDILDDTTFGHTGFTGTMVTCNPVLGLVVVLLTNRVASPADNAPIIRIRRQVLNAVASAVVR